MTLDQLVLWIIVGGIAGLLADAVVKGIKVGLVGAIVVGILGAFIGGWLFGLLNISHGGGILGDILTAFIGAVVLLVILRVLRRLKAGSLQIPWSSSAFVRPPHLDTGGRAVPSGRMI